MIDAIDSGEGHGSRTHIVRLAGAYARMQKQITTMVAPGHRFVRREYRPDSFSHGHRLMLTYIESRLTAALAHRSDYDPGLSPMDRDAIHAEATAAAANVVDEMTLALAVGFTAEHIVTMIEQADALMNLTSFAYADVRPDPLAMPPDVPAPVARYLQAGGTLDREATPSPAEPPAAPEQLARAGSTRRGRASRRRPALGLCRDVRFPHGRLPHCDEAAGPTLPHRE